MTGTGVVPSDTTSQGESAFYNANYVPWNNYEDLSPSINASSTLGKGGLNDLVLEYINTTGASTLKTSTPMNLTLLPGSFSISSDHSSLVWTSTVSTVPVPGSLGLFISGLLGLWKLQQRKR